MRKEEDRSHWFWLMIVKILINASSFESRSPAGDQAGKPPRSLGVGIWPFIQGPLQKDGARPHAAARTSPKASPLTMIPRL
jgi:hypothetical protein